MTSPDSTKPVALPERCPGPAYYGDSNALRVIPTGRETGGGVKLVAIYDSAGSKIAADLHENHAAALVERYNQHAELVAAREALGERLSTIEFAALELLVIYGAAKDGIVPVQAVRAKLAALRATVDNFTGISMARRALGDSR
jgi:hypothetical protein